VRSRTNGDWMTRCSSAIATSRLSSYFSAAFPPPRRRQRFGGSEGWGLILARLWDCARAGSGRAMVR
jgi:hypothetical protein